MNIEVTKKQNIRVDGVKYKAQQATAFCRGCHLLDTHKACGSAPCMPYARADGKDVIFVRKVAA